jgi:hypothetical protein
MSGCGGGGGPARGGRIGASRSEGTKQEKGGSCKRERAGRVVTLHGLRVGPHDGDAARLAVDVDRRHARLLPHARPHGPDRTWRVRGALARTSSWRLICTHLLNLLDAGALLPDGDAYEVRVDGEIHDHAAGHFPLHGKEVRLHALAAVAVAVAVVGVGRGKEGVSAGVGGRTCVCLRLSLSPGGASPRPGSSGAA